MADWTSHVTHTHTHRRSPNACHTVGESGANIHFALWIEQTHVGHVPKWYEMENALHRSTSFSVSIVSLCKTYKMYDRMNVVVCRFAGRCRWRPPHTPQPHTQPTAHGHIFVPNSICAPFTHITHIQHGLTTVECDINYVYGLAHETSTSSAQHTTTTTCAFVRRRPHTSLISVHCLWLSTAKLLPFGSVLHVVLLTRQQKKYNKST